MSFKKFLEFCHIYKVNEAYVKPLNDKFTELDEDFGSVAQASDSSSQIIDALNKNDLPRAVNVAMEFCKIDDEVEQLKEVKRKIEEDKVMIDTAIAAAESPILIKEIATSTEKEIKEHCNKIAELLPNIESLHELTIEKLKNIKSESANFTFAERLGTPEAVRDTSNKANQMRNSATEAKNKLEILSESIEKVVGE